MLAPRLDHLTPEDAEILALEAGPIAGHTLKVTIAERPAGRADPTEAIRERVASAVTSLPRCRQRLAPTPLGLAPPAWVDDPEFDPRNHVRRVETDGPVDRPALLEIVARIMQERLDRRRPLWTVDVVEGLEDERVAYVLKTHHCMADGTGAVRIAAALLWDAAPGDATARAGEAPEAGRAGLLASGVRQRVSDASATATAAARAAGSRAGWRDAVAEIARTPATLVRELRSTIADSPFDAPVGRSRAAAFVSCPLEELRRAAHSAGATLNDAILAGVAGGLRGWLLRRDAPLPDMRVRVPVSMHSDDEGPAALGNHDSFFCVDLPLAEPDPRRRLEAVRAETALRKREHDADTLYVLFADLAHLSRRARRRADALAGRPRVFSLSVSNVPGPRERQSVLGGAVGELHALAEIGERHGLRISALSHAGTISLGLCADPAAVADLDLLTDSLDEALGELARSG